MGCAFCSGADTDTRRRVPISGHDGTDRFIHEMEMYLDESERALEQETDPGMEHSAPMKPEQPDQLEQLEKLVQDCKYSTIGRRCFST
jgi:hypothetical protein